MPLEPTSSSSLSVDSADSSTPGYTVTQSGRTARTLGDPQQGGPLVSPGNLVDLLPLRSAAESSILPGREYLLSLLLSAPSPLPAFTRSCAFSDPVLGTVIPDVITAVSELRRGFPPSAR